MCKSKHSWLLLLLLFLPVALWPVTPPPESGTFFPVDRNEIDILYYLELTKPPAVKKVVFAAGNSPQTLIPAADSFDLSPNGRHLVYSFKERLYLTRTDGKGEAFPAKGRGTKPLWSANGELIAFIGKANDRETLEIMDDQGINVETLLLVDQVVSFAWEKTGETLLAVVARKNEFFLLRLYLDARKDVIYQFPPQVTVLEGALSPDSSRLGYLAAYKSQDKAELAVFLIDLNVYKLFRLTRPFQHCQGLSWSADSKSLIFSGDKAMHIVQGAKGNMFTLQQNVSLPVWSRSGNKIAFVKAENPAAIALFDLSKEILQDLDLGDTAKANLILTEKQTSLSDLRITNINGNNVTYSESKKIERRKVTEGMLLPLNSSLRTDAFSTSRFKMGQEVEVSLSPRTEIKIYEQGEEGYFEELVSPKELSLRVLEGQVTVKEGAKEITINAGQEYVLALPENVPPPEQTAKVSASLLLDKIEKLRADSSSARQTAAKSPAGGQDVKHPHDANALRSDCAQCHPQRPDWTRADKQTVEFTAAAAATCINCHRPGEASTNTIAANPHGFMNDANRCLDCHRERPIRGVDNYQTVTFVDTINSLCNACHSSADIGPTHPVGMAPKIKKYVSNVKIPDTIAVMDVPADLHLDENGLMTCATCHEPHGKWRSFEKPYEKEEPLGEIFGQKFYRTFTLRRNNYNSGLCQACHGQAGY